jgi:hypothetical protein
MRKTACEAYALAANIELTVTVARDVAIKVPALTQYRTQEPVIRARRDSIDFVIRALERKEGAAVQKMHKSEDARNRLRATHHDSGHLPLFYAGLKRHKVRIRKVLRVDNRVEVVPICIVPSIELVRNEMFAASRRLEVVRVLRGGLEALRPLGRVPTCQARSALDENGGKAS